MISHPFHGDDFRSIKGSDPPRLPRSVPGVADLGSLASSGASGVPPPSAFDSILGEFTARWERRECPRAEDYLAKLPEHAAEDAVVLIYREFCLSEVLGLDPSPLDYVARFPEHAKTLERLFGLQDVLGSKDLHDWNAHDSANASLPETGDEIGPFRLYRELGRGAFARVFLAEQTDLDDCLVVLKVSTRVTTEPSLLARASHSNIVPLLWHKLVDDGALQLIAMPFLGGATFSSILEARRKKKSRSSTGFDLLEQLDAVSAKEFPKPRPGRPAREAIEVLSYSRAVAWMVARLAEALDHAYSRGVLHGDVKPSNILLTADGMPMLLDFNLSVGWRPRTYGGGTTEALPEAGGTLPYMAPELLATVADPLAPAGRGKPEDRHRYDIYSLGVVLLEMLTARSPDISESHKGRSVSELASVYMSTRSQGGDALIRDSHRPVPASLRPILKRCLAPDPADRYRRAADFAEDLDLWRRDQPLIHAHETARGRAPFRTLHRHKTFVALLLIVGASNVASTGFYQWANGEKRREAAKRYARIAESNGAFRIRDQGVDPNMVRGDTASIARRHLEHYGVISSRNWRDHEEFASLDAADRLELEAWLMEHALRYTHALAARSAPDPARAMAFVDGLLTTAPYGPLRSQSLALHKRLGGLPPTETSVDIGVPKGENRKRIEKYLVGIEAEMTSNYERAIEIYDEILRGNPDAFWCNYRLACVETILADKQPIGKLTEFPSHAGSAAAIRYGHLKKATIALERCTRLRPSSAFMSYCVAVSLYVKGMSAISIGRASEASSDFVRSEELFRIAQRLDPDLAEVYRMRAHLSIELGRISRTSVDSLASKTPSYEDDLDRYEALILQSGRGDGTRQSSGFGEQFAINSNVSPGDGRVSAATKLYNKGYNQEALGQTSQAIAANPANLAARYFRAYVLEKTGEIKEAQREHKELVEHPAYPSYLYSKRTNGPALSASTHAVTYYIKHGDFEEARGQAKIAIQAATKMDNKSKLIDGLMDLARADAALYSKSQNESYFREGLEKLARASEIDPKDFDDEIKHPNMEQSIEVFGRGPYHLAARPRQR